MPRTTAAKPAPKALPPISLEALLTSPAGFNLPASPLQLAIVRAADGRPLAGVLDDAACSAHFGCAPSELGAVPPSLLALIAGVRGGKSLIASAAGLKSALTADLSQLMPHEIARVPIVAPTVDNATATFRLLAGAIQAAPALRRELAAEPTNDTVMIRRSDGRIVEIVVTAAHRGAITVRSRWLAGFVFDEVAMFGQESAGAAVNAEELLRAAETRLVRGGQGWLISSPYGPQGLLYDLWRDHFGKPGRVLVVHAPTVAMNTAFDREQVEVIRKRDPDAAAREYDAAWTDAETAFLSSQLVDATTRNDPAEFPYERGHEYAAAMDPATRGNAWTLVIATRKRVGTDGLRTRHVVVLVKQWIGSKAAPLSPSVVLGEIAAICKRYNVDTASTDQFSSDALRDLADRHGLRLRIETVTAFTKVESFERLRTKLADDELELPPDPTLRADLLAIRKLVTRNGISIELPRTADGRHADYAPALALVLSRHIAEPEDAGPEPGSAAWHRQQEDALVAAMEERFRRERECEWWERA